jgi:hypothetical protein
MRFTGGEHAPGRIDAALRLDLRSTPASTHGLSHRRQPGDRTTLARRPLWLNADFTALADSQWSRMSDRVGRLIDHVRLRVADLDPQ